MYKKGAWVAINNRLYEYIEFDSQLGCHQMSIIDIDEDYNISKPYGLCYFTEQEVNSANLQLEVESEDFWFYVVKNFIRQNYHDLTEDEIWDISDEIENEIYEFDIEIYELVDYIADKVEKLHRLRCYEEKIKQCIENNLFLDEPLYEAYYKEFKKYEPTFEHLGIKIWISKYYARCDYKSDDEYESDYAIYWVENDDYGFGRFDTSSQKFGWVELPTFKGK